ncbi:Tetratricopeptide repeat-like superfamily protein isoform 1 [Hibiscus syriacus]|uniref:Tetratricopeptide repeat-like superfamily protein isoform 1 n=1 Tax=Hibiscus syriacus TaxID=106335 RepID=A0A6A3CV33_HIBSY|nr:Tetratricopeptide repeat-like superfamily protein isoform 1 [Hibiscus syriacus]
MSSLAFAAANSDLDTQTTSSNLEATEERIEKVVYRCWFMTLLAVFGSLTGSILCFIKGCTSIVSSFMEYFVHRSKVILLLVEATALAMRSSNGAWTAVMATVAEALASTVNVFEHIGQVDMVFEMYGNNGGFFNLREA